MKMAMDTRKELEATMGENLRDKEWRFLEERDVGEVQSGKQTISWLSDQAWKLVNLREGKHLERPPELLNLARSRVKDREEALSALVAQAAARDPLVVAWRKEAFKDRLLRLEEVKGWIKGQEFKDGGHTRWVEVGLSPRDWTRSFTRPHHITLQPRSGYSYRVERLEYWSPGDHFISRAPTAHGSILDRLRQVGEILSHRYGWRPAEATIFVLTGEVPRLPAIRATVHVHDKRSHIVLDVDMATSPRVVADAYRRERREALSQRRPRALSKKHLQLAVFLGDRPEGESWRDRLKAWNRFAKKQAWKEYPPEQIRNFQRDGLKARERLVRR